MVRSSAFLALWGLLLALATVSPASAKDRPAEYAPPEMTAGDYITYPVSSMASGVVAVAVYLDGAGRIKKTEVLRDIPSLTAPALLAVQQWTFKPATLRGKAVDSIIIVNIIYNPADYRVSGAAAPVFGKELHVLSPDQAGFLPPKISAASWAAYPLNSVAQGSVILDARINAAGRVTRIVPVWRAQALTSAAIDAAKKCAFEPAALDGAPIAADAVIGYVFRPAVIANPVAKP